MEEGGCKVERGGGNLMNRIFLCFSLSLSNFTYYWSLNRHFKRSYIISLAEGPGVVHGKKSGIKKNKI